MSDLLDKLATLADRHRALEARLADPEVMGGPEYPAVLRDHARLGRLVSPYRELRQALDDVAEARELLGDPEMREMAEAEVAERQAAADRLLERIKALLVQADALNDRPALLEVRAGAGGDEACLFAGDLVRMYQLYCQRIGWQFATLTSQPGEMGGFKEAIIEIRGEGAFGLLRYEAGGHRVQRVPATESQGRIHTSAATVAVMPEAGEVDVHIAPEDLHVDVFRASGAGGQHVNTTDSAVRVTHLPTGIAVSCQDEKSQHANRERAMKILRSRLLEAERERQEAARAAERKQQVGSGDRSDRIRTYNFPQNRITDHRIGFTSYHLDRYLEGHLDELQQAMIEHAKVQVLAEWDGRF